MRRVFICLLWFVSCCQSAWLLAKEQTFPNAGETVKSKSVVMSPEEELRQKLSKLDQFSAHFVQTVWDQKTAKDKKPRQLSSARGKVLIKRPNQFRWEIKKPDQSTIISDGKSVWLDEPMLLQVQVMNLEKAVINTPFLLITSQEQELWRHYTVKKQSARHYHITSKKPRQAIVDFEVQFDNDDQISYLVVQDIQGIQTEYSLTRFNTRPWIKKNAFVFVPPKDYTIDDQR